MLSDSACCLKMPYREAPQYSSCLAVTHRGTSKDSHDPQSASLSFHMMGGKDPGKMWRTQPLYPSIHLSIYPSFTHPSIFKVLKCLPMTGDRAERQASAAIGRMTLVRNEWHMMHFRPLEMDLTHVFLYSSA